MRAPRARSFRPSRWKWRPGVDTAATGSFTNARLAHRLVQDQRDRLAQGAATGTHKALKSAAKSAGPNTKRAHQRQTGEHRQAQDAAASEEEPRRAAARRGARSRAVGKRHPQAAEERFAAVAHGRQADEVARRSTLHRYSCTRQMAWCWSARVDFTDCRSVRSIRSRAADLRAPVSRLRRQARFAGPIATIKCFEDNSRVRDLVAEPGRGRVLVIDAGGSMRRAVLGDMLAQRRSTTAGAASSSTDAFATQSQLRSMPLGVKALGTCPLKTDKRGEGQRDVPVRFAGVNFRPGDWLYADEDGVIVARRRVAHEYLREPFTAFSVGVYRCAPYRYRSPVSSTAEQRGPIMSDRRYDRRTLLKNALAGLAALPAAGLVQTPPHRARCRTSTRRIRSPSRWATCTTRRKSIRTRCRNTRQGSTLRELPAAARARKATMATLQHLPRQARQRGRLVQGVGREAGRERVRSVTLFTSSVRLSRRIALPAARLSPSRNVSTPAPAWRRPRAARTSSAPPADTCGCSAGSSETLRARSLSR